MKESLFTKSIKTFDPKLVHTTLIDFIYFIILFGIGILSYLFMSWAFGFSFSYLFVTISVILVLLLTFFLISAAMGFFKNLIWNITLGSKRKSLPFIKFTAVWLLPWIVVFYLLRNALPESIQPIILSIYSLLYLHFTAIARLTYKKSIKKAFLSAFDIGFWQIKKFIVPYIIIALAFWVVMVIVSYLIYVSETLFITVTTVALFMIIAWARYYISLVYTK